MAFKKTIGTTIKISDSQNLSFADCFVGHTGGDAVESNSQWMRNLNKVDISAPIWRSIYPTLVNILTDDPGAPKNTFLQRKVSINGGTAEFHESYAVRYVQQTGSIEMRLSTELTSSTSIEAISTLLGLAGDASGSYPRLANNLESLGKLLFARKDSLYP